MGNSSIRPLFYYSKDCYDLFFTTLISSSQKMVFYACGCLGEGRSRCRIGDEIATSLSPNDHD